MTKHYSVWSEPKDGSDNGKWTSTFAYYPKDICEEYAQKWNNTCPSHKHEVRERFEWQS